MKKVLIEVWHDTLGSQDYITVYGVWCNLILSILWDKNIKDSFLVKCSENLNFHYTVQSNGIKLMFSPIFVLKYEIFII